MIHKISKQTKKVKSMNNLTSRRLGLIISVLAFAIIGAGAYSLITGNNNSVDSSLASAQEPADINNDNKVDIVDLSILLSNWNKTGTTSDLNSDNKVDIVDLSILLSRWGALGGSVKICENPVFTTSDVNGGWSTNGYYVHNNMWNWQEGGPETLYACSHDNWYVISDQPATTSVKTYPNVHLDINNLNGRPLSNYSTITSTFAGEGPKTGIYNYAYDLWLNGVGWGGGTTEFMIWTENFNQWPLGSKKDTVTFGGQTYDAFHFRGGGANVVSLVSQKTQYSGTVDLMAMIQWAIGKGWVPANPTINQIGYGVEICSTNDKPERFNVTDFSVEIY